MAFLANIANIKDAFVASTTKVASQVSSQVSSFFANEEDGEGEENTHVCRVLRKYYADNGRPRPDWLPPGEKDEKKPEVALVQPMQPAGTRNASRPDLSTLFNNNGPDQQQPPLQQPQSMRAGRRPVGGGGEEVAGRPPLQSQRTGSFQSLSSSQSGGVAASHSVRVQDRLKQRYNQRTASPAAQNQNPYASPPPPPPPPSGGGGGGGQYDGGGGGQYDGGGGRSRGDQYGRGAPRQGLPSGPRAYR